MKNKVIVIRESYLYRFDDTNYVPIQKDFDLAILVPQLPKFYSPDKYKVDLTKLNTNIEFLENLSKNTIYKRITNHIFKKKFIGIEKYLKDASIVHVEETFNWYTNQIIENKKNYNYKIVCTVWENIPFIKNKRIEYELGHILFNNLPLLDVSKNNFYSDERKRVKDNIDLFITTSQRAKEALIIEGYDEEKIKVIMPSIDHEKFFPSIKDKELVKKYDLHPDEIVIGTTCRLTWEKGIFEFIYAANKLINDKSLINYKFKFLIIGNGELNNKIRKLIEVLGIKNNFIIENSVPYDEMIKYNNLMDIFTLNSLPATFWQEQIGQVLYEAMATATPVIAANSGSIPEVVGDAGLLYQSGDFLDLYIKLKEYVTDENLRKINSEKGRKRVEEKFTIEKFTNETKDLYTMLLKNGK